MAMIAGRLAPSEPYGRSSAPPIDLDHLRKFTLGNRDLEEEVLLLFADQIPEMFGRIREAETVQDWRIAVHTLKGSARAIGAWGVASLAERAERLGDIDGRHPAMAGEIKLALRAVHRFIEEFVQGR
jgi:chemotaxis protein histidine kinase CheA